MARQRSRDRADDAQPGDGTLRLCAASRVERAPDDLIRFVAGPAGIVPDLARRLPGRGVWITADRDHVAKAVKTKAFPRSLKVPVPVADDLAEQVGRLLERRVAESLSLANKAGAVITGFEKIDRRLASGEVVAMVHGSDAADGGRDKLDRKFLAVSGSAESAGRIVTLLTIEQISLAIGRPNVVHAALITGGATKRFLIEAGRLGRYRSGIGLSEASKIPANHDV